MRDWGWGFAIRDGTDRIHGWQICPGTWVTLRHGGLDAVAGALRNGSAAIVCRRVSDGALDDDAVVRALRHQPEDGLQVARSVRHGRAAGTRRPVAPPAWA